MMSTCTNKREASESYWAQAMYDCLQNMATQNTNAVLLMFDDVSSIEVERHYPEAGMLFGNNQWRVFYHCHQADNTQLNEHGHFHIFTTTDDTQWAHVAGLVMDDNGQPQNWFAVNRWVTGGPWLTHDDFLKKLEHNADCSSDELAGKWLYAMLHLYQHELDELLLQRTTYLKQQAKTGDFRRVLEDRGLYTLATKQVDLQLKLESSLSY